MLKVKNFVIKWNRVKLAFNSDFVAGDPKLLINYNTRSSFAPTVTAQGGIIPVGENDSGFDETMGGQK